MLSNISYLRTRIIVLSALALASCSTSTQEESLMAQNEDDGPRFERYVDDSEKQREPANAQKPVRVYRLARWEGRRPEADVWSQHIASQLETQGSSLLSSVPSGIHSYCPAYGKFNIEDRKKFWTYFISSIAFYESGFNPNDVYKESFKNKDGSWVYSRGLLQISLQSSKGYNCGFRVEKDLHDPKRNLTCGIKIMNNWIRSDKVFAEGTGKKSRGIARYWSVMRSGKYSKKETIKVWTSSYCNSLSKK